MKLAIDDPPVIFISLRDAGHYISMDQPQAAYEATRLFVTGGRFCQVVSVLLQASSNQLIDFVERKYLLCWSISLR